MKHYSFISEADQINLENPTENNGFEPLIKSKADIPLSNEQAEKMVTVAKIREIEAKTKQLEAQAKATEQQAAMGDPNAAGGIDPMTGMPMGGGAVDPATGMPMPGGGIDPMTGMPMSPGGDPGAGGIDPMTGMPMGNDPLQGLGDKSTPPDPMGGMGGMDPMTGMPMPGAGGAVYTAIGRAYKLKDIFEKLFKIKSYLRDCANTDLESLYKDATVAFDMFKLVINNLKIYKEKVDELIVMYYELIKIMLEKIKNTLNESEQSID